jgi:hypothetical protein
MPACYPPRGAANLFRARRAGVAIRAIDEGETMSEHRGRAAVQEHPPTRADRRPRERAIRREDRSRHPIARGTRVDPTTRREADRAVLRGAIGFAAAGALAGALLGLFVSLTPGPLETDGAGGAIAYALGFAAAAALVAGVLATLVLLEREDGRIERGGRRGRERRRDDARPARRR